MNIKNRLCLIVLDGWGIGKKNKGNAIYLAQPRVFNYFWRNYPKTALNASGEFVGLPLNQPGNSEAGHINLGAGRKVEDDAVLINQNIKNKNFFHNEILKQGTRYAMQHHSKVHLMGLVTEENSAHSSPLHWLAILDFLKKEGVKKVYLHLFTDGRDSSQHGAIEILRRFSQIWAKKLDGSSSGLEIFIASICGRFYAMDRTKNWKRTEKTYNLLTQGEGRRAETPEEAILRAYNRGETDEFIKPTVIERGEKPIATISDNDLVIFMNLRSDRARQLTKVFVQEEFEKKNPGSFKRKKKLNNLMFLTLTNFGPDLDDIKTVFSRPNVKNSLPLVLGREVSQLYIAETEKYAHVTFFFSGGYDYPLAGEKRIRIDSPVVDSYAETPAMATPEVVSRLIKESKTSKPNFILVNLCNPDMLGHTGNLEATVDGIKVVDNYLGKLVNHLKEKYIVLVTADHGNAEEMINLETGETITTHTKNLVPFILITDKEQIKLRKNGILADVAPTILELMGIPKPKEMTGKSLLE